MEKAKVFNSVRKNESRNMVINFITDCKVNPYEVLFLLVFIIYLVVSLRCPDDAWFINTYLDDYSGDMFGFLKYRVETWSTRLILEAYTILLLYFPLLYRLSMPLWIVGISKGVIRLFDIKEESYKWAICSSMLLLPISFNGNAGFVCTTVDYVLPIACLLWAIIPIVECQRGKRIKKWNYIVEVILLIIVCNMEYYCAPTFLIGMFLLIKGLRIGKGRIASGIMILISLMSVGYVLLAPMNTLTGYNNAEHFFEGFNKLSIIDKMIVALTSTAGGLISTNAYDDTFIIATICLGILIIFYGIEREKGILRRIIYFVPLFITIGTGGTGRILPKNNIWRNLFYDRESGWEWDSDITLILAIVLFISIEYVLLKVDTRLGLFGIIAIICRMTMGLSSSVLSSGLRTFYPLLFVMCVACGVIWSRSIKYKKICRIVMIIGILLTNIMNLIYLI